MTRRRRDYRKILIGGLLVFVAVFSFTFLMRQFGVNELEVDAANLANFDPGYIISDYQMGNYTSMTETEIQAWLTSKNSCQNTDYDLYLNMSSSYPSIKWHFDNGHFVCISEELFGDGETIGEGETAAHIIWQAAQDYHINPQVLLVLLQKESSLITDSYPNSLNYRAATGYGCPDTAACSSTYYGFKNQVRWAASLFSEVLNGGWTNYPLGDNFIRYGPNCSNGSVVNIRSLATSALYRYTPYQPSSGVLAAGYGLASDSTCSAYGNRNFYLYFEDWFSGITDEFDVNKMEKARVPDGIYNILLSKKDGIALDISGGVDTAVSGGKVQLWRRNATLAQEWEIVRIEEGVYKIQNLTTKLALENLDGKLIVADVNDQCSQEWKLLKHEEGYLLVSNCENITLSSKLNNEYNGDISFVNLGKKMASWYLVPKIANIQEGEYYIRTKITSGKIIEIDNNIDKDIKGANIQLWEKNLLDYQRWKVILNDDNTYTFINPSTGKAIDVSNASTEKGANIQLWNDNGSCAQKWSVVENDGYYTFISACSDLVMDVSGGKATDGSNINLWSSNNSDAQKWILEEIKPEPVLTPGTYILHSKISTNKTIDISGGVDTAVKGTNIQLWRQNGTKAQDWKVILNDDNTYTFINPSTGKAIDVSNASTEKGANIQLWNDNGSCAQKWSVVENDGYYTFISACSDLVMDVSGGKATDGSNINLWSSNNSDAQKWILEEIRL